MRPCFKEKIKEGKKRKEKIAEALLYSHSAHHRQHQVRGEMTSESN